MIIGSHVSMSAPGYLLGAMQETVGYHANACMIYTGAPQNTRRVPVEKLRLQEARDYMQAHGLSMDHVIVHAPYIINLANTVAVVTYEALRQLDFPGLAKDGGSAWRTQKEARIRR